jgi:hypothetical protein
MCIGSLSATWAPPVDIGEGDSNLYPEIAVDATGNVTAVWREYDGIIQSSTKLFGGSWQTTPDNLSQPGQSAADAQIAVDPNGNATAVWVRDNGSGWVIQSSTKPFGGSWQTTPDNLSQPSQRISYPQIAVDPNGNATAVWEMYNGSNLVIQSSTKPFGGSWQTTPDNLSQPGQDASHPQIAVDPNGNVTAVWARYDGSNEIIQSSTKPFGGSWQTTPDNLSQPGQDAALSQIAVDPNGNATAVWDRSDGGYGRIIQSSTKPFGGSWQTTPDNLSQPGQGASLAQIAVDPNGNATAVWERSDGSNYIIQSSTKPFGGSWQITPDNLSQPGHDATYSQIAVDANGNATAVWQRDNGSVWVVQSSSNFFGPRITLLNPSSGSATGGNSVTITGTGFVDVTFVLFGSTPATSFSVVSPTTIIAIVPPGTGVVDVRVFASSITSPIVAAGQYTYQPDTHQPTSPTHFRGIGKHSKKKLLLKTNWRKSTTSNVSRYEIFARNQRIAIISASKKPKSTIHLNPRHKHHLTKKYRLYLHDKYKIRAVDSFGTPSSFTNIKVKH